MESYVPYILMTLFLAYFLARTFKMSSVKKKLPKLLKEGALVVDVRSPAEYKTGHIEGSINIPLQEISNRYGELDQSKTILLCCASGGRSAVATNILKSKGFLHVHNVGGWSNLCDVKPG